MSISARSELERQYGTALATATSGIPMMPA
jgi:hypothetical protein